MKKKKNISDYLFFQEGPGVRKHQYTSNGVKLLNVANLVNGRVDLSTSERYISIDEAYGKYKHFLADEGDLIIASSGIKVDYFDKKMGLIKKEDLPICMNTSTIRFKSLDKSKLNINYFMYYLKSQSFKDQLSKQITGSAQLNFGPSHLKKMEFPIVNIGEQSLISSVLGNLESQIRLKEQQLTEYDQLIKSRFVEMFGDPGTNKKQWNELSFGDICKVRQGLQIPISMRLTEKLDNCYKYLTVAYLNGKKVDEYIQNPKVNVICKKDDILMTRTGNTGMVITNVEGVFHNNFFLIDFDRTRYNKTFLYHYLNLDYIQSDLIKRAGTSTIPDLNHGEFYKIFIYEPPIMLQNNFDQFVQQIDKLKFRVQQSLNETQKLFDSLMQEYFG